MASANIDKRIVFALADDNSADGIEACVVNVKEA
jgi:hypothetical protein